MELTTSIEIERPIADVFAYWADLENGSEWASAVIERTKITDGPVGVGTRYRAVEQFPGRKVQFTVEITEFEPNRRMAAIWEGLPVEAGWVATFEEFNGGTRLTMTAQNQPIRWTHKGANSAHEPLDKAGQPEGSRDTQDAP